MKTTKLPHILNCHPIIRSDIERADNTLLYFENGNTSIDFLAGDWSTALGHNNKRINKAMTEQINKIIHLHYMFTNDIAEKAASKLIKLLDFDDGCAIFLNSGSEAVELGIRAAAMIFKNSKLLTFTQSYLSAYSSTSMPRNNNTWVEVDFLKCDGCRKIHCSDKCDVVRHIDFSDISAFVFEPGSSCGKVLFPPQKLVAYLCEEIRRHEGLIMVNEVTTGFGRTGQWFGYNHYNISPDIVALGKALGNGYPVSSLVMSRAVADKVEATNFRYVQSHQNDPLGCIIANEVIDIFYEEDIISCSRELGAFFIQCLENIQKKYNNIKSIRGRGLMLAIELDKGIAEAVFEELLNKGYFVGIIASCNILNFFPALTISKESISMLCEEIDNVLGSIA